MNNFTKFLIKGFTEFPINKLLHEISDKQFDEIPVKENELKASLEDFEVQDTNPEESEDVVFHGISNKHLDEISVKELPRNMINNLCLEYLINFRETDITIMSQKLIK